MRRKRNGLLFCPDETLKVFIVSRFPSAAICSAPPPTPVEKSAYIVVHARRQAPFPVAPHGVGGHGDYGDLMIENRRPGIADLACGFYAVHIGHLHIHQHQVVGDCLLLAKTIKEWKSRQISILEALRCHQSANSNYLTTGIQILELATRLMNCSKFENRMKSASFSIM